MSFQTFVLMKIYPGTVFKSECILQYSYRNIVFSFALLTCIRHLNPSLNLCDCIPLLYLCIYNHGHLCLNHLPYLSGAPPARINLSSGAGYSTHEGVVRSLRVLCDQLGFQAIQKRLIGTFGGKPLLDNVWERRIVGDGSTLTKHRKERSFHKSFHTGTMISASGPQSAAPRKCDVPVFKPPHLWLSAQVYFSVPYFLPH